MLRVPLALPFPPVPVDTLHTIRAIAAKQFGVPPDSIDTDAPVDQLGIDSLDFLELLFELEDEFGLPIPPESVNGVRTLGGLATTIDGLIAARAQQAI